MCTTHRQIVKPQHSPYRISETHLIISLPHDRIRWLLAEFPAFYPPSRVYESRRRATDFFYPFASTPSCNMVSQYTPCKQIAVLKERLDDIQHCAKKQWPAMFCTTATSRTSLLSDGWSPLSAGWPVFASWRCIADQRKLRRPCARKRRRGTTAKLGASAI